MCILLIDPVVVFFMYFERKLSYLAEQHIFLKKICYYFNETHGTARMYSLIIIILIGKKLQNVTCQTCILRKCSLSYNIKKSQQPQHQQKIERIYLKPTQV